ncbi:MAG: sulfotransferase domain-containing protein [Verrucomicrobia bacterium]|nr:MAG: sulfotransferase domain-containing protein [Verrucomicrobiota bacterium]
METFPMATQHPQGQTPGEPSPKGRLPDFVVVGATKAGTTSLDFYLSLHPEIFMPRPKEAWFFMDGTHRSNWHRGEDWYQSLFKTTKRLCGEATPAYSQWPSRPRVAERIHRLMPGAKLIYLVREPLARLRSHYLMEARIGLTHLPFPDYIGAFPHAMDASRYGTQLRNFLRFFPLHRIHLVESSRLATDTRETVREVFGFLGVDPSFDSPLFEQRLNVTRDQPFASPLGRRLLAAPWLGRLKRRLPPARFRRVRDALLLPFRVPTPDLALPDAMERALREDFRGEIESLRSLSGLPFASLG